MMLTIIAQDMDANENIVERLKQWMEDEGISSPSEYGANTPMYIYRMWGGEVHRRRLRRRWGRFNDNLNLSPVDDMRDNMII